MGSLSVGFQTPVKRLIFPPPVLVLVLELPTSAADAATRVCFRVCHSRCFLWLPTVTHRRNGAPCRCWRLPPLFSSCCSFRVVNLCLTASAVACARARACVGSPLCDVSLSHTSHLVFCFPAVALACLLVLVVLLLLLLPCSHPSRNTPTRPTSVFEPRCVVGNRREAI